MIVGGLQSQRHEQKGGRQKKANVLTVEALFQQPINFELEVENKVSSLQFDLLVISARMNRFIVKQIFIDTGSSVNLIKLKVFNKLGLDKEKDMSYVLYPLVGLGDKSVPVLGVMNLTILMRNEQFKREIDPEFAVVDIHLLYNAILG